MITYEHCCSRCEKLWISHEWVSRCDCCNSHDVTNWHVDSDASHRAQDLVRLWRMSPMDEDGVPYTGYVPSGVDV